MYAPSTTPIHSFNPPRQVHPDLTNPATKFLDLQKATMAQSAHAGWLPDRVVALVALQLSVPDLCALAQVSRACSRSVSLDAVWVPKLRSVHRCKHGTVMFAKELKDLALPGQARTVFMALLRDLYPLFGDIESSKPTISQRGNLIEQGKILLQLKGLQKVLANPAYIHPLITFSRSYEVKALTEFKTAYNAAAMDDAIQYAQVLVALGRQEDCVKIITYAPQLPLGAASDYLDSDKLNVVGLQTDLSKLADSINRQAQITSILEDAQLLPAICQKVIEKPIAEVFSAIIITTKLENLPIYLETVPTLYILLNWFVDQVSPNLPTGFDTKLKTYFTDMFDLHIEAYLEDELAWFSKYAADTVAHWNLETDQAELESETFLMRNVTKAQDKKDILASFKTALMVPVSIIPFANTPESLANLANLGNLSTIFKRPTEPAPRQPVKAVDSSFEDAFFSNKTSHLTLPTNELDAHTALMTNKLEGIKTLFSLELALNVIQKGREAIERSAKFVAAGPHLAKLAKSSCESVFVELVQNLGHVHVKSGFERALDTLDKYNSAEAQKLTSRGSGKNVEPLVIFIELVNIGDLIQQMIHMFYEQELASPGYIDCGNSLAPAITAKRKFDKMVDEQVAHGLNRGLDVLLVQIDYIYRTQQKPSDFLVTSYDEITDKPTATAQAVVDLLKFHTGLLAGSTDISVIDVFKQEVGTRFFGCLCRHIKTQTISVIGASRLLQDLNLYSTFIETLNQRPLNPYFTALKEVGLLYLINGQQTMELAQRLTDVARYQGVFQADELLEFVERREDWVKIRRPVQKGMKGLGADCIIM